MFYPQFQNKVDISKNQVGDLGWVDKAFKNERGNNTWTIQIQGIFMIFSTFHHLCLFILIKFLTSSFVNDCERDISSYMPVPDWTVPSQPISLITVRLSRLQYLGRAAPNSVSIAPALSRCLFSHLHYNFSGKIEGKS